MTYRKQFLENLFFILGRIARTWKYDLKFHGNLSYVRFPKITPLQTSTICWWMLLNVKHDKWKTVFSYQRLDTNQQMVEFAVKSDGLFRLSIGNDKRYCDLVCRSINTLVHHS